MVNLFKNLRPFQNYILKIKWEIHFFTFSNTDQNAPKKNLLQKYGHSHFKSAFKLNFRLREVVKLEIHKYAYLRIFSSTTSRSRKLILKADFKCEYPYFYSKFFLERFGQYLKKSKNGFPIVFIKCNFEMAYGFLRDLPWVFQSFWSIFNRKITLYRLQVYI